MAVLNAPDYLVFDIAGHLEYEILENHERNLRKLNLVDTDIAKLRYFETAGKQAERLAMFGNNPLLIISKDPGWCISAAYGLDAFASETFPFAGEYAKAVCVFGCGTPAMQENLIICFRAWEMTPHGDLMSDFRKRRAIRSPGS
jgi:hypothetical protein